ncbi:hypothetical protein AMTR_s00019p00123050 [Amborella trichopoda]|uniref:Uncharacterized protein n=1 Tax=Amborella trichopoda TaxID=13333 RepID=W1PB46_AMBTC|nr:hypothetical protein AMTR_s00019p00123050 [Amborella trichopoda]
MHFGDTDICSDSTPHGVTTLRQLMNLLWHNVISLRQYNLWRHFAPALYECAPTIVFGATALQQCIKALQQGFQCSGGR